MNALAEKGVRLTLEAEDFLKANQSEELLQKILLLNKPLVSKEDIDALIMRREEERVEIARPDAVVDGPVDRVEDLFRLGGVDLRHLSSGEPVHQGEMGAAQLVLRQADEVPALEGGVRLGLDMSQPPPPLPELRSRLARELWKRKATRLWRQPAQPSPHLWDTRMGRRSRDLRSSSLYSALHEVSMFPLPLTSKLATANRCRTWK